MHIFNMNRTYPLPSLYRNIKLTEKGLFRTKIRFCLPTCPNHNHTNGFAVHQCKAQSSVSKSKDFQRMIMSVVEQSRWEARTGSGWRNNNCTNTKFIMRT